MSFSITSDDDIFVYFEVIERSEPDSVIDIGMFLERIGAVSRNVKDKAVPDSIVMDAYISKKQIVLPVYKNIYNEIHSTLPLKKFDISVLIRPHSMFDGNEIEQIAEWIQKYSKLVLIDSDSYEKMSAHMGDGLVRNLSSGDNNYYLITYGV